MSLIEGIGDEVVQVGTVVLVVFVCAVAWWTTNITDSPLLTTVLILERRTRMRHTTNHRNQAQLTATAVAVTDATGSGTGNDTGQNGGGMEEREADERREEVVVSGGVEQEDDDKQEGGSEQRTLVVETDVEPATGDIFEIVDEGTAESEPAAENTPSLLRRRRLAFFVNRGPTLIEPVTPTEPTVTAASNSGAAVTAASNSGAAVTTASNSGAAVTTASNSGAAVTAASNSDTTSEPERTASRMEPEAAGETTADSIRIRLKYLNDNQTVVEGRLQEQLGDFKRRHFSLELAAEKMVRLIFNGQVLQCDNETLQGYGLFDNCVVHCLVHNQRVSQSQRSVSQSAGGQSAAGNGRTATPPEWNLGTVLYASLSICLGFALYCRYQYSHLFTVTTSAALFGLSAIFAVTLVGQFLPDSETVH
ncbi:transmembrane and ubiquitin-like domain-containing protein 1 [Nilaparvata lugens]|uniref:transmembrane and ubiquitin-like domain-containing protein 1 n=1 Tax=Nilaparvata lugens TaxID=108931 RepID=UPI00193D6282|nr:transmembrane and ubiquitin-like domain-containing protein 1 [Nilaparvata lugens]XP_039290690.1 transmembrane and ubiquitin-like domain-containing protein 1 [Nilaparvata lugens]